MAAPFANERLSKLLPYQYQTLKTPRSFRLLQLNTNLSRHGPTAVTGKLVSYDLDSCPSFAAISYVWGDPTRTVPFECEGKLLHITPNCHDALQRLMRRRLKRLVWVDAICIDQANLAEKSVQVAMMGDVYLTASHVMIWLGRGSPATDDGMQRLRVCAAIHRYVNCPGPFMGFRMKTYAKYIERGFDDTLERHITMLAGTIGEIFYNAWFERLWVLQEAVLPSLSRVSVYCGHKRVLLQSCFQLADFVMDHNIEIDSTIATQAILSCTPLLMIDDVSSRHNKRITLSYLLETTIFKLTSNPLDYLYATHGIATQIGLKQMKPDYNKSIVEVYTETARCCIEEEQELSITLMSGAHQTPNLPSWVPDFSTPIPPHRKLSLSSAALTSHPWWCFDVSGLRLTMRGTILEALKACGPAVPMVKALTTFRYSSINSDLGPMVQTAVAAWIEMAEIGCSLLPASETVAHLEGTLNLEEPNGLDGGREMLKLDSLKHLCDPRADHSAERASEQDSMLSVLYLMWAGRQFVLTEAGRMGIAGAFTRPGDSIALLSGLPAPFIIRQQGPYYRLLGPAFVYGIMHGQAWPHDESKLQEITFV